MSKSGAGQQHFGAHDLPQYCRQCGKKLIEERTEVDAHHPQTGQRIRYCRMLTLECPNYTQLAGSPDSRLHNHYWWKFGIDGECINYLGSDP